MAFFRCDVLGFVGFALWIDQEEGLAWAQGTHEYRPMGMAVIASTDRFRHRDFQQTRKRPKRLENSFTLDSSDRWKKSTNSYEDAPTGSETRLPRTCSSQTPDFCLPTPFRTRLEADTPAGTAPDISFPYPTPHPPRSSGTLHWDSAVDSKSQCRSSPNPRGSLRRLPPASANLARSTTSRPSLWRCV